MAEYRLDSIANLARQMAFAPVEVRAAQLTAAERLLHELDPAKAYPIDFIVFRITGYQAKGDLVPDQLTGLALQHDLGMLIEDVSGSLDVRVSELAEPVLAIEDVTEKFNVTSKTIQRWRRRGLPARKFIFGDGRRRVGFLLSSVERFLAGHEDQVQRGANFSQVSDAECQEIIRRARRLASQCGCCTNEITRRIGRKLNRSPLTILHTVRKHDAEHPADAIFTHAATPPSEEERVRILRGFKRGLALRSLARRTCRPRATIYRLLVEERLARLNKRNVKYIDDGLYNDENAETALSDMLAQEPLPAEAKAEDSRIPRDLPLELRDLYRTPLLSPSRERALFLKFNYCKREFVHARRRLDAQFARHRDIDLLERLLHRAVDVKNEIVQANLRLVVSVARKHLRPGLSLMELLSEGNLTLMRTVESFDVHKGNRFSTYATLALMKGFARSVPLMLAAHKGQSDVDLLSAVPDTRTQAQAERSLDRDQVRHLLSRLDERERKVLSAHFGLEQGHAAATFEEVGKQLGLTKQRVRQIEQTALAKLRTHTVAGTANM